MPGPYLEQLPLNHLDKAVSCFKFFSFIPFSESCAAQHHAIVDNPVTPFFIYHLVYPFLISLFSLLLLLYFSFLFCANITSSLYLLVFATILVYEQREIALHSVKVQTYSGEIPVIVHLSLQVYKSNFYIAQSQVIMSSYTNHSNSTMFSHSR